MTRQRLVYLALAALVVLGLAFVLNARRDATHDLHDTLVLPTLASRLDVLTAVTLRHGGAEPSVTLHKRGQEWTVAERNDYPADVTKLRKLLQTLSEVKIVEEKTANPANFSTIGVDDPTQSGAIGTEVVLMGLTPPASLIVGKSAGQGNFVRRGGENQSFVAEPAISVDATPAAWIDSRVLDVPTASIQSVELKPASGTGYVLRRATPDGVFALSEIPKGRQALDATALAPSPNTLANLTADDVAAASSIDFSQAPQVIITLKDGAVLTLTGNVVAEKHMVTIKSSKDAALNAKCDGRAFALAGYRYDNIFRPLDQLLVPLPPPPAKDLAPGKKNAAPRSSPVAPPAP